MKTCDLAVNVFLRSVRLSVHFTICLGFLCLHFLCFDSEDRLRQFVVCAYVVLMCSLMNALESYSITIKRYFYTSTQYTTSLRYYFALMITDKPNLPA